MDEYKFCVDVVEHLYLTLTSDDFTNLANEVKNRIGKWSCEYTANDIRDVAYTVLSDFVEKACIKEFHLNGSAAADYAMGLDYNDTQSCIYAIVDRILVTIK